MGSWIVDSVVVTGDSVIWDQWSFDSRAQLDASGAQDTEVRLETAVVDMFWVM